MVCIHRFAVGFQILPGCSKPCVLSVVVVVLAAAVVVAAAVAAAVVIRMAKSQGNSNGA